MALRYASKMIIPSCRSCNLFNPFSKHSSLFIVAVVPMQIRDIHLSTNLWKELVRFNLADIGEGIKEVLIKEWYIKVGDRVSQFHNICEVQSDKATVTITSRYDGLVKKIYYKIDETAIVGKPLIDIEIDSPIDDEIHGNGIESIDDEPLEEYKGFKVLTTPSVRKLAKENNINLSEIVGSGPQGRILKEDIVKYINKKSQADTTGTESSKTVGNIPIKTPISIAPKVERQSEDRVVPISGLQKSMMKMMSKAKTIPDFSYCDEVDVTNLSEMKHSICSKLTDTKVTFLPFFIKAASIAILQFPQLNAHLDESCDNLIYKASHNIGFAVDSPDGLVVPKIHSVQTKSILEISNEISQLIKKANQGKLSISDLTNGTFTISNIGSIGGTYTSPVILWPELVIGGIGKIQRLPRFNDKGEVVAAHIMQVSWTADHRVVDGATMARFSNLWKLYLERPEMLLLNLK